jgi:hypothetical protein
METIRRMRAKLRAMYFATALEFNIRASLWHTRAALIPEFRGKFGTYAWHNDVVSRRTYNELQSGWSWRRVARHAICRGLVCLAYIPGSRLARRQDEICLRQAGDDPLDVNLADFTDQVVNAVEEAVAEVRRSHMGAA